MRPGIVSYSLPQRIVSDTARDIYENDLLVHYSPILAARGTPKMQRDAWRKTRPLLEQYASVVSTECYKAMLLRADLAPLLNEQRLRDNECMTVTVSLDDATHVLDFAAHGAMHSVGRIQQTSVHPPKCSATTRLDLVQLILVRVGWMLFLVDPGAQWPTRMVERENATKPMDQSVPGFRQCIILTEPQKETVALKFDNLLTFVVNPKLCDICSDLPCSFMGKCGHYCMCGQCAEKIRLSDNRAQCELCPVCRSSAFHDDPRRLLEQYGIYGKCKSFYEEFKQR